MKTRSRRRARAIAGRIALIGGISAALVAVPLAGQDGPDCRCVDRNGKEIPNCTCFRTPSPHQIVAMVTRSLDGRAGLGIMVEVHQDPSIDTKGARVQGVLDGGPADKAGIRKGDIITEVAGKSLLSPLPGGREKNLDPNESAPVQRLLAIARDLKPGTEVPVRYLRDGAAHTATVKAGDLSGPLTPDLSRDSTLIRRMRGLPDSMRVLAPKLRWYRFQTPDSGRWIGAWNDSLGRGGVVLRGWGPGSRPREFRFQVVPGQGDRCPGEDSSMASVFGQDCVGGVQLVALNPGLASYFHTGKGVLVTDVRKDSRLGLQPGDVILSIGAREATSPDQVRRILRSYDPDETIAFHIERKGRKMDVSGHMGES